MLMECWRNNRNQNGLAGFSLVELLLAGALFTLFAWGAVAVLFSGLAADRLGEETTSAANYAREGVEAVRAIKTENFDDLGVTDAVGLVSENGFWKLDGSGDQWGKYARVIRIETVKRDSEGKIDENGDIDPDTRQITVIVRWNVTPAREDSVVLETYLTRWQ